VKKLNKKTQDKQQVIMSFMISKSRSIKREGEGGKMNIKIRASSKKFLIISKYQVSFKVIISLNKLYL
jgi:hypothetical protein